MAYQRNLPGLPSARFTLLMSMAIVSALALLPQESHSSAASSRAAYADLGTPVAQIISLRAPEWNSKNAGYQPLPLREERLNALLSNAVDVLTTGEAVESRARLLGLQASLQNTTRSLHAAQQELATLPVAPCANTDILGKVTCHFATTRSDKMDEIRTLAATIEQRQKQIVAERASFAADLNKIGIDVKPEQAEKLLQMVTASDIISLHAVYANLTEMNTKLQQAAKASDATAADIRRYYGLYTVLLEVALHMHEDIYFKLRTGYLPRLEQLAADTTRAYREAEKLNASATRPELRAQLGSNMNSLKATLRATMLYRETLASQAEAINASWQSLREQHRVAANSYRSASLSASLLDEMKASGRQISAIRQLTVPAIDPLGNAALQREFERLTQEIQLPNT